MFVNPESRQQRSRLGSLHRSQGKTGPLTPPRKEGERINTTWGRQPSSEFPNCRTQVIFEKTARKISLLSFISMLILVPCTRVQSVSTRVHQQPYHWGKLNGNSCTQKHCYYSVTVTAGMLLANTVAISGSRKGTIGIQTLPSIKITRF